MMHSINLYEAKTHLSHYLDLAAQGETVVICKRNVPIAELRSLKPAKAMRKAGQWPHAFEIPDSFFAPLPDTILEGFSGDL